jgi:hypothetical protein
VADVPSVIVATRLTNAQAKARELIIVLVNFVFMIVFFLIFLFLFFGLLSLPVMGNDFRPFTDVQNGNQSEVTRKVALPSCQRRGYGVARKSLKG